MSLSSIQLDAFFEVSRAGSFSRAARALHVTQSALSQRVLNLEDEIGTTLILREPSGLRLTEAGQELLRYCQKRQALEEELAGRLGRSGKKESTAELAGRVRIAGFSTVMHSAVYPALDPVLKGNPDVQLEAWIRELPELHPLLKSGAVDFVITSEEWKKDALKGHLLGHEDNVLIQPATGKTRSSVFLDHDADDRTTEEFLEHNGRPGQELKRSYLDDIYGVLEGVALGWGRAVVPRHLLRANPRLQSRIKVASGFRPLRTPVRLYHYEQPYYSKLETAVIETLTERVASLLD